jgi:hypothetical protein
MQSNQQAPSLLINLRNYAPGDGNDALENFITEAFAWQLNAHPSLADFFLNKVLGQLGQPSDVSVSDRLWNTQVNLGGKRPDMVLETSAMAYIFEHKAWTPLHESQLDNYRQNAATRYGEGRFKIVLITATKAQHTQLADAAICWRDVHGWIHEWAGMSTEPSFHPLDFCELLAHEGLGPPAPISHESILAYFPARGFEKRLHEAANRFSSWMKEVPFEGVNPEGSSGWGRIGLGLFPKHDWRPSLFVGFLIDPDIDHQVPLANPSCPDFSIIADFDQNLREKIEDHPAYRELVNELENRIPETGFEFHHHLFEDTPANRWHPFHIRKPLLDVLKGTRTSEEQDVRFKQAAVVVLEIVLGSIHFQTLRAAFSKIPRMGVA